MRRFCFQPIQHYTGTRISRSCPWANTGIQLKAQNAHRHIIQKENCPGLSPRQSQSASVGGRVAPVKLATSWRPLRFRKSQSMFHCHFTVRALVALASLLLWLPPGFRPKLVRVQKSRLHCEKGYTRSQRDYAPSYERPSTIRLTFRSINPSHAATLLKYHRCAAISKPPSTPYGIIWISRAVTLTALPEVI